MSVMPFVIPTICLFTVERTAESSTDHQSKLWPHLILIVSNINCIHTLATMYLTVFMKSLQFIVRWAIGKYKILHMIKFVAFAAAKLYLKNKQL